ncbi:MAG: DUF3617 domain-containing protein [Acidobacteriota bacterium]|nr:DUF3617 domain-containing protein [Acidobacteriota bacterium]
MKLFIFAMSCVLLSAGTAAAQQKTQGETWRATTSIEMSGISIPPRTIEFCVPAENDAPFEAMLQQNNDSCRIENLTRNGNKISADLKCSGRDAMEGHVEMEMLGDTMRGTMTTKTTEGAMTIKYETVRLGKACEVQNAADLKRQAEAKMPKMPTMDLCQINYDGIRNSSLSEQAFVLFSSKTVDGQPCTKHAVFKNICSAAQTSEGFASLDTAAETGFNAQEDILSNTLNACGLGSGNAAKAALQAKLLPQAEKENRWDFLLRYGADEYYPRMVELAKKDCAGRGFTVATPGNGNLCRDYGMTLARNDRQGALATAGCREEIPERGVCIGYGNAGAGTQATSPAAGRNEEAKPKAEEPANKIRQGVRGLLGR